MYKIIYLLAALLPMVASANTIFINASIYTVNKNKPWVKAVVIDNKKINYVGTTKKALTYKLKNTKIIDLKGQFMMPGIIDAHTHIAIAALLLNQGIAIQNKGKSQILQQIAQYAKEHPEEDVVSGFGFYPLALGTNGPTVEQLDAILPNKKVFFISNNGHSAWVNTKTLHYLGLSSSTKDPLSGIHYYMRDTNGSLTGFLVEGEALWPHFKKMNIATPKRFYKSLKSFLPTLSRLKKMLF
ncbi:Exoenzymes regulatory protein AepA precursor [hydrothermal vent metagenome]|uniref:Exoenzymes regulatory protein AepA n=1 Tax=hydrothermal vent metagenome TaxID=652676 RepID=A0A1W1CT30_9ZZZZ